MRRLFLGLAMLPFLASAAMAAEQLTNAQMDRVAAGQLLDGPGLTGLVFGDWPPSVLGGTQASLCNADAGCTGAPFAPTTPQAIFNDLGAYLLQAGYPSQ